MDFENNYNENDFNKEGFVKQLQETEINLEFGHMTDSEIETKLYHVRKVTRMLIEKAKWVEEKRKFLETSNMYLKNENADLAKRYVQSQDEVNVLNSKLEELKVEMASLRTKSEAARDGFKNSKSDKAVSCRILPALEVKATSVSSTQTFARYPPQERTTTTTTVPPILDGFCGAQSQRSEMVLANRNFKEPVIMMTKKELRRLDKNMESLRAKLEMKESAWAKVAEREREQRVKLMRCKNEMLAMTNFAQCRSQELSVKTRDLRMALEQLESAEKEIKYLKRIILKTKTVSNNQVSLQPSWSMAVMKQLRAEEEETRKKKKPKSAKKSRKTKTKFDSVPSTLEEIESYMFLSESSAVQEAHENSTDDGSCASTRPFTALREITPDILQRVASAMSVKSYVDL